MTAMQDIGQRVDRLVTWYGDGTDGSSPTVAQWRHVLERSGDRPLTLVNFFKMRDRAVYPDSEAPDEAGSGQDAFNRYAAVSMPTLQKVGGRFLLTAPAERMLVGADEDWDMVVVASYPDSAALLALFEDPAYRDCFVHRTAACARQKVVVCGG
jgi:uncharacterized protein (DUF1330 family)